MNSDSQSYINNNLLLQIDNSDSKTLFIYGIIIIIFLAIFQRLSVGINIVLALVLASLLILYLNSKNQLEQKNIKEIYDNKTNLIRPKPKKIQNYPKFLDFVFSIQDFYNYNVPAYELMIDSIDNILELYEESINDYSLAAINYNLVDNQRKEAVNNLHSIIHNIPSSTGLINKFNESIIMLNNLIYEIMDNIYSFHKLDLFNNGYNREVINIIRGPKPENFYEKEPFSFDIF